MNRKIAIQESDISNIKEFSNNYLYSNATIMRTKFDKTTINNDSECNRYLHFLERRLINMGKLKYFLDNGHSRTEIENAINEWVVGRNSIRDREILRLRFINGHTLEYIAEQEDLSIITIKNIICRWYPTINGKLKSTHP